MHNNATPENNNDPENISSSKYYDIDRMDNVEIPNKNKSLSLFHINACSLKKNFDDLQHLLSCAKVFFWHNYSKTTTMSVLMPLPWLAGVSNFCSNLLSPFLLIVLILSSQAILSQILLYTLFTQFPWLTLLAFPCYFASITWHIWELMYPCMTWPHHHRQLWIISSIFTTKHTLSRRTSVNTLSSVSPHTSSGSYDAPPHTTLPHLQQ